MSSRRQKAAAKKNVKKASAKWKSMSPKARAKAMPSRPYKTHTKLWNRLVKALRKEGKVKSPEAVATWKLGEKSFLKRKLKTKPEGRWKKVEKKIARKSHKRKGYTKKKGTKVKPTRVKKSKTTSKGWKKK